MDRNVLWELQHQQATANQILSSVSTLINRASSFIHIQCTSTHSQPRLFDHHEALHTRDTIIPSPVSKSVYVPLSLPAQPLIPCLLLTNKPGRNLVDDFISQMMSWEIHPCQSPLFLHLFLLPFLHPAASSPSLSTPDLPLYHTEEPDPVSTPPPPPPPPLLHTLRTSPCQTKVCEVITSVTSSLPLLSSSLPRYSLGWWGHLSHILRCRCIPSPLFLAGFSHLIHFTCSTLV